MKPRTKSIVRIAFSAVVMKFAMWMWGRSLSLFAWSNNALGIRAMDDFLLVQVASLQMMNESMSRALAKKRMNPQGETLH